MFRPKDYPAVTLLLPDTAQETALTEYELGVIKKHLEDLRQRKVPTTSQVFIFRARPGFAFAAPFEMQKGFALLNDSANEPLQSASIELRRIGGTDPESNIGFFPFEVPKARYELRVKIEANESDIPDYKERSHFVIVEHTTESPNKTP